MPRVGIGVPNTETPSSRLEVRGSIKLGDPGNAGYGEIWYDNQDNVFYGRSTSGIHSLQAPGHMPNGSNEGDLLYHDGNDWAVLSASSTDGALLTYCNGIPQWGPCAPDIITTSISSITNNSANSGGEISYDGGTSITSRGVCYASTPNPTLSSDYTTDGSGTGTYTSTLTGLSSSTTYYARAYATNTNGTFYGDEKSFTTSP